MLTGTNLKYANSYNIRIVLENIRLHGPLSRIDISRSTHLTAQTVTNITKKLLEAGLIFEADRHKEGRGAPSIMLKLNPTAAYSIGLDFDKDHLTCILVDLNGEMCQRLNIDLDFPTPEEAMNLMSEKAEELIQMEGIDKSKIWGVGVGFPGPLVVSEGSVRTNAVNPQFLPGWENVPVVRILEDRLKVPVYLENNASAAAIGERWYGEGKHISNFFYVFFGAGLGGGLIMNGQLFPGHTGNAGELGYYPTPDGSDAESMFDRPHLGVYFNLSMLYKKLNSAGYEVKTPSDLDQLYQKNNDILIDWLKTGTKQLAVPMLAIEYLIDPEVIYFGGRLPNTIIEKILNMLQEILPTHRIIKKMDAPSLRCATAGQDAAALGLATLPLYDSFAPVPNLLMKNNRGEVNSFKSNSNNFHS
ncbi:MAG: ROK family transcriptional regulator [Balneolales bacterium]